MEFTWKAFIMGHAEDAHSLRLSFPMVHSTSESGVGVGAGNEMLFRS